MTRDLKSFKLKARGDAGSGKTELLEAFAFLARRFGMTVALCNEDHHLIVMSTKEQRFALYRFNGRRKRKDSGHGSSFAGVDSVNGMQGV